MTRYMATPMRGRPVQEALGTAQSAVAPQVALDAPQAPLSPRALAGGCARGYSLRRRGVACAAARSNPTARISV